MALIFRSAALLLGLLLPQPLEQGQVLVKIIGVQQRLIVFCQRCLYPRRDRQLLRFDACKVGFRRAGVTGRSAASFSVAQSRGLVGIRKIRPEGVILSGGLIAKAPQP
ncbi:hypothetical protein ACKXF4_09380, partial [Faecalibacterium prausnitzii]|uniref:hypothetical protein n=1 Tax=Faecalibacterium prausnitzii TaxID=853 RepID=UPI003AAAC05A